MVSPTAFHTVTEDVLDNLSLKPWWEIWMEYAYRTSIAVLAVLALSPQIRFNCLYHSDRYFAEVVLTEVQTNAVNPYCMKQVIPWYLYHGDFIVFLTVIALYVITHYWTHVGGVKNRLTNIAKIGLAFMDVNVTAEEMKNKAALPLSNSSSEKHRQLREIVELLTYENKDISIRQTYAKRCIFLGVTALSSAMLSFVFGAFNITGSLIVTCEVSNDVIQLRNETISTFRCVDEATSLTCLLLFSFGVTVLAQSILAIVALKQIRWRKSVFPCITKDDQESRVSHIDDIAFLFLMMNISEQQESKIQKMLEYILGKSDFIKQMCKHSDRAIVHEDLEHFRILKELIRQQSNEDKFWATVSESATRVLWDKDSTVQLEPRTLIEKTTLDFDYKVHLFLNELAKTNDSGAFEGPTSRAKDDDVAKGRQTNNSGNYRRFSNEDERHSAKDTLVEGPTSGAKDDDVEKCRQTTNSDQHRQLKLSNEDGQHSARGRLVEENQNNGNEQNIWHEKIFKNCNWHLLSCIMTQENAPECPVSDIPLDKLDSRGRSYLFYLLRKSSMDNISNRFSHFNEIYRKNVGQKMVHFEGKTMSAEEFFHLQYSGMQVRKMPIFRPRLLATAEAEKGNEPSSPTSDDHAFQRNITSNFKSIVMMNGKNADDDQTYINATSPSFHTDKNEKLDSRNPVVIEAIAKGNWEVLVGYINTYIVEHKLGCRPDTHGLLGEDIFRVHEDNLEEIFQESLKRPRNRMYFVPTAAEYILSIATPECRKRMDSLIDKASIPEDIRQRLKRQALS